MILYLAGVEQLHHAKKAHQAGCKNVLGSALDIMKNPNYFIENIEVYDKFDRIFMDSGAFSAWTLGKEIDIDVYAKFLIKNKSYIETSSNLDVIGDWKATLRNQQLLEVKGANPIPVFHLADPKEPFEILEQICEEYEYIALGGLAGKSSAKDKLIFLDQCWSIILKHFKKGKQIKVHGFGVTGQKYLERYPWYSVDSTSWLIGEKFKTCYHWDGRKIKPIYIDDPQSAIIKDSNLNDRDGKKNYVNRSVSNGRAMMKMEKFITKLWKNRGIDYGH